MRFDTSLGFGRRDWRLLTLGRAGVLAAARKTGARRHLARAGAARREVLGSVGRSSSCRRRWRRSTRGLCPSPLPVIDATFEVDPRLGRTVIAERAKTHDGRGRPHQLAEWLRVTRKDRDHAQHERANNFVSAG